MSRRRRRKAERKSWRFIKWGRTSHRPRCLCSRCIAERVRRKK